MAKDRVEIEIKVTDRFSAGLKKVQTRLGKATAAITTMRGALIGLGAITVISSMVRVMLEFETAMNRVKAVSNASAVEFNKLKETARELGAVTVFSAKEVAEGMGFLAQAGFKVSEIIGTIPATLNLAAAAQLDLATAADIVSNVMQGYGLAISDAGRATDVLAKAFTTSNTNLSQLGEALKLAGPVASGFGIKFEEAAAALGLMANAGFQASLAGTGLRNALVRLANPTKQIKDTLGDLGINLVDSKGKINSLVEIIRKLETSGATAAQMMTIFGMRAGPAMLALLKQGSVALTIFTKELEKSGGTAERVAKVQMQGFPGAVKLMQSAWVEFILSMGDQGGLRIAEDATNFITATIKNIQIAVIETAIAWQMLIVKFRQVVAITNLGLNELANKNLADARIELKRMLDIADDAVPVFDDLNTVARTVAATLKKDIPKAVEKTEKAFESLEDLIDENSIIAGAPQMFRDINKELRNMGLGAGLAEETLDELLDSESSLAGSGDVFKDMSKGIFFAGDESGKAAKKLSRLNIAFHKAVGEIGKLSADIATVTGGMRQLKPITDSLNDLIDNQTASVAAASDAWDDYATSVRDAATEQNNFDTQNPPGGGGGGSGGGGTGSGSSTGRLSQPPSNGTRSNTTFNIHMQGNNPDDIVRIIEEQRLLGRWA